MKFSQEELDAVSKLFDGKRGARSISKELGVTRHRILCIYKELGFDNSNIKAPTKEMPTHKPCKICTQDKLIDNFRYRKQHNGKYYYEPYCNDQSTWTWQIDHIIPHSDLPYDSMDHPNFQKCWALDNLRPLSAKQNLEEGTRRIRHKSNIQNSDEIIMHKAA